MEGHRSWLRHSRFVEWACLFSQRFLSRIQRIRLALRDGDAECKDLEQKIRRSKLALEKQLLREKKAIETEQKYKVGFAKVKLRLEEEKDREQEMLRQLRYVAHSRHGFLMGVWTMHANQTELAKPGTLTRTISRPRTDDH